jgi:hypothetical protein
MLHRSHSIGLTGLLLFAASLVATAQPLGAACSPEAWPARFNGTASRVDNPTHLVAGPDDTIYVCGTTGVSTNNVDLMVLRYSNAGDLLWQSQYNGSSHDEPVALCVDPAGNAYVGASITGGEVGDMGVVKFNQHGTFQWAFRYRALSTHADFLRDLEVDAAGNAYLLGQSDVSVNQRYQDIFTAKLGPDGQPVWMNTHALASSFDDAEDLDLDGQGGILVAAHTTKENTFEDSILILKYAQATGAPVWNATIAGTTPSDMLVTDGAIFITGFVSPGNWVLSRCSLAGAVEWTKPIAQTPVALAPDGSGGVFIAGTGSLARYESDGDGIWQQSMPIDAFGVTPAGDLCVAGTVAGPDNIHDSVRTANHDPDGNLLWETIYEGVPAKSIDVGGLTHDQAGNAYVALQAWGSVTDGGDFLTVKYDSQGTQVPALAAPGALAGTAASISQIDLTWSDQSTGETGFALERSTGGAPFSVLITLPPGTSSYSEFGLGQDTTYSYRVRALGDPCPSSYSNEITVKTLVLAPGPPTGLTVTVPQDLSGHRSLVLQWTVPSYARRVLIERAIGPGPGLSFSQIASVEAPTAILEEVALTPGTTYTYRARAENESGQSGYTSQVGGTTPQYTGGKLVLPKKVKFPNTRVGAFKTKVVKVSNGDRTKPLRVEFQAFPPYQLVGSAGTIVLPPRGKLNVTVRFAPAQPGAAQSGLVVRSDDPAKQNASVALQGKGLR